MARKESGEANGRAAAQVLQTAVLDTAPLRRIGGLEIAARYLSAGRDAYLGGDYYDVFPLEDGAVALVTGDVSGKGAAAIARTFEVKYALRIFLQENPDPAHALFRLNDYLCQTQRLAEQMLAPQVLAPQASAEDFAAATTGFVAVAVAVLHPDADRGLFAVAGAEPPLLLRHEGSVPAGHEAVPVRGLPLGLMSGMAYDTATLAIRPGDTVILMTDGLTEARHGRRFLGYDGVARLAERERGQRHVDEMGDAILRDIQEYAGGPLQDDACLLLARRA